MSKVLSILIFSLIILGLVKRKDRYYHVRFMLAAFCLDMLLVLYIELTRSAVKTAISPPHPFVFFHVVISVAVVFLYLFQIASGWKILKGNAPTDWHRRVGILFFIMRFANLATGMFVDHFVRH